MVEVTFEAKSNYREGNFSEFREIQEKIFHMFSKKPSHPILSSYAVTQTTLILRWEPLNLHKVEPLRIKVFKDGDEATQNLNLALNEVKITGLSVGCSHTFHIVVYTTAGEYASNKISVTTLNMEDLRGLNVCFGDVAEHELEELKSILARHSASYSDEITAATTHFVTSKPGRGRYEEARDLGTPIVTPAFLKACDMKKRIQPASSFSLQTPDTADTTDQSPK